MGGARILFLADTHLGFDHPVHPRIKRRRRSDDFFSNYLLALDTARREEVDIVVHGGDVFTHNRIPQAIIVKAFEPLIELADEGIPVYIVPGNHERSRIPQSLFSIHDNIRIFSEPSTYFSTIGGLTISFSGFPYIRRGIRDKFAALSSDLSAAITTSPDVKVLCMHHIVEGARIGVFDYMFRRGSQVIRGIDVTDEFDIILSGHIHRYQILSRDAAGNPYPSLVYYPGSIERTSFAERNEVKGYLILDIKIDEETERPVISHQFIPLPARPMVSFDVDAATLTAENLADRLGGLINSQDKNGIVRITVRGDPDPAVARILTARYLRSLAPGSMNVTLSVPGRQPHVDGAL